MLPLQELLFVRILKARVCFPSSCCLPAAYFLDERPGLAGAFALDELYH